MATVEGVGRCSDSSNSFFPREKFVNFLFPGLFLGLNLHKQRNFSLLEGRTELAQFQGELRIVETVRQLYEY